MSMERVEERSDRVSQAQNFSNAGQTIIELPGCSWIGAVSPKLAGHRWLMFIVSTIEDKVRVHPQDLAKPSIEAVTAQLERTYIDKVVPDLGLVVTLFDILDIQGGFVFPSDGAAHFDTKFRVVIFKPFVGEVIVGKLQSCDNKGLRVSLGFFSDIIVPNYHVPEDYWFQGKEELWVWKYADNELFLDLEQEIRIRVMDVKFHPVPTEVELRGDGSDDLPKGTAGNPFCPMEVIATTNGDGLGLTSWWSGSDPEAMDE